MASGGNSVLHRFYSDWPGSGEIQHTQCPPPGASSEAGTVDRRSTEGGAPPDSVLWFVTSLSVFCWGFPLSFSIAALWELVPHVPG